MNNVLEEIKESLPKNAMITEINYEGSEIILYTKNKEFFADCVDTIKKIVSKVKKRIEVRADPSIISDEEKATEFIRKTVPKEAGIKDIYFEPEFAKVVIHAEKPGLVIGKNGETLLTVKKKTFWTPEIKRAPVIDSELIRSVRRMLHKEAGYRKKFLNKLGEKIYAPGKDVEWIRVTHLGAAREVGRSCIFLQTPQTKVLMDCGMAPGMGTAKPFPYLDAPEFHIQDLDAVVLSHAHTDHCLPPKTPITMADGSIKCIGDVKKGDEILSLNFNTGKLEPGKCTGKTSTTGHKKVKKIITPFRSIEASPNHRFFTVKDMQITEKESQDLSVGEYIPITAAEDQSIKNPIVSHTAVEYDKRRKDRTELPTRMNPQLALLLGYLQGDGHFSSSTTIRATDSDTDLLEKYKAIICELFGYRALIKHHTDKSKNAWILEINNAKITRFLNYNFPDFLIKSTKRRIPNKILESDRKTKNFYLRGLMDAEGSVSIRTPNVRFGSYSKDLLNCVKDLLTEIGIQCRLIEKDHTVSITSAKSIRKYANEINFESLKKQERLQKLVKKSDKFEKDIVPITSSDLKKILDDAGLFGTVHNSYSVRQQTGLYDWLRRGEASNCTRRTANSLLDILESRVNELMRMNDRFEENNLKYIRQNMSISLAELSEQSGIQRHILEYREKGYIDTIHELLVSLLKERLVKAIMLTQTNIESIRKILSLPVLWEPIKKIETSENPYKELVDIEVLPNRNFIAKNIIVHNSGLVPYLYEYGYRGPLYCTRPTRDISALLQLDYLQICQRENKKAFYSSKGVEEAIKHCIPLEYGEVTDISSDMRLTFQNAGHLLGSSTVHIHIGEGLYNVLYTGDMKYQKTKIFEKTSTEYARAETVIIESTYGADSNSIPPSFKEGEIELIKNVKKCIDRGGKVIIPAFAVGRSQDIITILADSNIQVPIYLDGMIWDTTAIHTAYPEFMARNIQTQILHKGKNPFIDPRLHGIGSGKEREKVFERTEPCVVLSTSGMLQGGPAIEYISRFSENEKNMLLFVGYQAEGTLGRRIQKGWKQLQLENGKALDLKLEVATVSGLKGHSTQQELLSFLQHLKSRPRKVLTNHGSNEACVDMARKVHKLLRVESMAPKNLETIRLR